MTTTPVMTITDEQIEEIEAEAKWCSRASISSEVESDELLALISRLRAAEKDADRYRWLRNRHNASGSAICVTGESGGLLEDDHNIADGCLDLDAAIDTAMEQSK